LILRWTHAGMKVRGQQLALRLKVELARRQAVLASRRA
jgi:hypothetical protein